MKSYDVVTLGELLIDMTDNGLSAQGNTLFEANPGGAPGNVLAMLAKFGHKTAFIGKVGNDIFGRKLRTVLKEAGIDVSNVLTDPEVNTTLAFVETKAGGDRDFSFYRNPGADMMLRKEEINAELLKDTKIFHFGTLSMTHPDVREATMQAIRIAKENGALISFDPNLRPPLWKSLEDAKEQVLYGLAQCDILKISDNEIQWLTGLDDFTEGVNWIRDRFTIPLIMVSMGRDGSRAYYKDPSAKDASDRGIMEEEAPFLQEKTIETTGAGDTFGGCILHFVLEKGLNGLQSRDLKEMLVFANAAASIITTRKGALKVMPEVREVERLMESENRR